MSEMFKYNIEGEEEIENTIKLVFGRITNVIEKSFRYIGEKIVADAVKIIDANKLVYKHNLRDKVTKHVFAEAERIILEVGSGVPYSQYVHDGSTPHWPPVDAMREYVRFKIRPKLGVREKTKAHTRKRKHADQMEQKINSIAFLISRKISKEGTKGVPFLRLAFAQNQDWLVRKIVTDLQAELA